MPTIYRPRTRKQKLRKSVRDAKYRAFQRALGWLVIEHVCRALGISRDKGRAL